MSETFGPDTPETRRRIEEWAKGSLPACAGVWWLTEETRESHTPIEKRSVGEDPFSEGVDNRCYFEIVSKDGILSRGLDVYRRNRRPTDRVGLIRVMEAMATYPREG